MGPQEPRIGDIIDGFRTRFQINPTASLVLLWLDVVASIPPKFALLPSNHAPNRFISGKRHESTGQASHGGVIAKTSDRTTLRAQERHGGVACLLLQ